MTVDAEASGGDAYDGAVTARYLDHRHAGVTSPNVVMEEPAVLAQLGDLSGLRVVDLGCGDGTFADVVLGEGAQSYRGIDGSAAMIDVARTRSMGSPAQFELGRIEDFEPSSGSAELVTARMAFHYLRDLAPTLATVQRALTPGGRLLFTITHPVITSSIEAARSGRRTSWTVDRYFEVGERRRAWFGGEVTWFHRTVEQYLTAVLDAGFDLEAVSECEPDAELLAGEPEELARRRRVPLVLLVAARRR